MDVGVDEAGNHDYIITGALDGDVRRDVVIIRDPGNYSVSNMD
jgi:hypothetical protein